MRQKRVSKAYDKELEYCDDLVGFSAKTWATRITPWMKELRRFLKDKCLK